MLQNSKTVSVVHSHIPARRVGSLKTFNAMDEKNVAALPKIGIHTNGQIRKFVDAMDAIQPTVTTGSMSTLVQFLQNWMPGFVQVITAARNIDDFVGITTSGAWEDEQIVQGVIEEVGAAQPYGDYTNVPYADYNANWNYRTNVRFEQGFQITTLDEARASRVQINQVQQKTASAALALEISRNYVGFLGYNAGANNTYGLLNDPGLPNYISAPSGTGGTTWATKTMLEIVRDILTLVAALRSRSGAVIDPKKVPITLGLASTVVDYLSKISDFNVSAQTWIKDNYPNMRIVNAPELNAANGGANVGYMYADEINDASTDDGRVFNQNVPSKLYMLGVEQKTKGIIQDYSNATSGIMLKRPWAVVRITGI